MKKISIILLIIVIYLFCFCEQYAYSWKETKTHPKISESAVNNSVLRKCYSGQPDGACNYLGTYHGFEKGFENNVTWVSKNSRKNRHTYYMRQNYKCLLIFS